MIDPWNHEALSARVQAELWTSWAGLLRSYAAAHGLNSSQHAVVEVSADEITLRVGSRWLRFTQRGLHHSGGATPTLFALTEDGHVRIGNESSEELEEMDFAAERLVREMMQGANLP